jgi:hypothetical protein
VFTFYPTKYCYSSRIRTSLYRIILPPNPVVTSSCVCHVGGANARLPSHYMSTSNPFSLLPPPPPQPAIIMASPAPQTSEHVGLSGNDDTVSPQSLTINELS